MRRTASLVLTLLAPACGPPDTPRLWAVDRGAGALVVLDERLARVGHLESSDPVRAVRARDGALWVVSGARAREGARLSRIGSAGERDEVVLAPVVALARAGDDVLVLEAAREGTCPLWAFTTPRERRLLGDFPGAVALACHGAAVLVGLGDGTLVALGLDGVLRAHARVDVRPAALAPAGDEPGWWLLGGGRLVRLDAELAALWSRPVGPGPTDVAPLAAGGVWVGGDGGATRLGPDGREEAVVVLPPGPWQAEAASGGRLWLRGGGAVVEVRWRGPWASAWRSEGGFDALEDLVLLEPRP